MSFFGGNIEGQGDHQPENWKSGRHEYWEKIKEKNAEKLEEASSVTNINGAVESSNQVGRTIESGDTLSAILKDEVGLSGRMLLLALTHLSINGGMNIDNLNAGETIVVFRADTTEGGSNLYLHIEGRDDVNSIPVFPETGGPATDDAPPDDTNVPLPQPQPETPTPAPEDPAPEAEDPDDNSDTDELFEEDPAPAPEDPAPEDPAPQAEVPAPEVEDPDDNSDTDELFEEDPAPAPQDPAPAEAEVPAPEEQDPDNSDTDGLFEENDAPTQVPELPKTSTDAEGLREQDTAVGRAAIEARRKAAEAQPETPAPPPEANENGDPDDSDEMFEDDEDESPIFTEEIPKTN